MDIVQMANDLVLGLQRLGDFFKGYEALVKLGKFVVDGEFSSKLDDWSFDLSGALFSSRLSS
ncbi:cell wall channel [Corynebacterium pseudotuberculosis]|uniref:Cell wall channel n=1 Tax=Corynebacterium pseudotuberculosis 258 TaxID=1168865 RepID=A0AAU8Q4A7_CORPS|nr:hypothetical protein [Corynebacterium pseudotuberculosis]AER69815.1 Cell wall channel [Corynebacterium pseudotuberculosis 1/06-A]AEQ07337.2 cell wall channel [Corynebacterium pseudotuberculosis CIP 52.97]AFB73154.1 cell wall channel [Corynebacterium pseudotuberculosis 316]AFK17444.1 cell wall channel [Corynebacterium pseudotuberculosis 258]AKN59755.1 cell wall channel [Corynebacterium pseudotuberculosis 31]